MNKKYIWLFGENLGETANNNSFYLWLNCVDKDDEIEKYFILSKTPQNVKIFNNFPDNIKKYICWKNSLKHFRLWYDASMYFVTLSYRDVRPEKLLIKNCNLLTERPVIYLQHGISGIKQLGYNGTDYNNNMFRFIYYNPYIREKLISINNFREYQLWYGEYMPRHKELVKQYMEDKHKNLKILFFPTWREYFGDNFETKVYLNQLKRLVSNLELNNYLKESAAELTICLHPFFSKELLVEHNILGNKNITITTTKDIDILHEIATSNLCITDYSSVGFDFTILNKPVILYQPDRITYLAKRNLYCSVDELEKYSVDNVEDLICLIINKKYTINNFFRKRLPNKIDLKYIQQGFHIEKMYEYFSNLQKKSIVFLGYNFYGVGGTVNATHALAEGLMEQGYLVTLLSLKKHANVKGFTKGLNMRCLINEKSGKKLDLLKKIFNKINPFYGYFINDTAKKHIGSYGNFSLKYFLSRNSFQYFVSTRESIHLYLDDAKNIPNENKYYFYHTDASVVNIYFPSIMSTIVKREIGNPIFVTLNNKMELGKLFGFKHYNKYLVIGNSLSSNRSSNKSEIETNTFDDTLTTKITRGIFLFRITSERQKDIANLLSFGKYLVENKISNIKIDVYGNGDYKNQFIDAIIEASLEEVIKYAGKVDNPKAEIIQHDFVIDFSEEQSFGMTYIEGILNGKMVFCLHNNGSDEVLRECPECFYNNWEELVDKINNLQELKKDTIKRYELVAKRYSRDIITKRFIDFINH